MNIFISWSGERSRLVAELLNTWVQCVLQAVKPWLSTKDIDKGSIWFSKVTSELSNAQNGIVCLTKDNLNNPWILFESGALAKGLTSNRVYTFLIDLSPNDIKDPLAQFNHTLANKQGVYELLSTINNGLESQSLKEDILKMVFETNWPQFESDFKKILHNTSSTEVILKRSNEDLLNEILTSVRVIDKRLRQVEPPLSYTARYAGSSFNDFIIIPSTPIDEIGLSIRAYNAAKAKNIMTVSDLLTLNVDDLECTSKVKEEIKLLIAKIQRDYNS